MAICNLCGDNKAYLGLHFFECRDRSCLNYSEKWAAEFKQEKLVANEDDLFVYCIRQPKDFVKWNGRYIHIYAANIQEAENIAKAQIKISMHGNKVCSDSFRADKPQTKKDFIEYAYGGGSPEEKLENYNRHYISIKDI